MSLALLRTILGATFEYTNKGSFNRTNNCDTSLSIIRIKSIDRTNIRSFPPVAVRMYGGPLACSRCRSSAINWSHFIPLMSTHNTFTRSALWHNCFLPGLFDALCAAQWT
ncbi:hypothetical protein FKM82_031328 [Ascaphus truei]